MGRCGCYQGDKNERADIPSNYSKRLGCGERHTTEIVKEGSDIGDYSEKQRNREKSPNPDSDIILAEVPYPVNFEEQPTILGSLRKHPLSPSCPPSSSDRQ